MESHLALLTASSKRRGPVKDPVFYLLWSTTAVKFRACVCRTQKAAGIHDTWTRYSFAREKILFVVILVIMQMRAGHDVAVSDRSATVHQPLGLSRAAKPTLNEKKRAAYTAVVVALTQPISGADPKPACNLHKSSCRLKKTRTIWTGLEQLFLTDTVAQGVVGDVDGEGRPLPVEHIPAGRGEPVRFLLDRGKSRPERRLRQLSLLPRVGAGKESYEESKGLHGRKRRKREEGER